ncbi:MAG: DivIVA domain-containing protein [Clostridiales bacterium]|jgi:hypothetical protein|nr:DivIVA domain-containing protein [Clostridiales bacterium]
MTDRFSYVKRGYDPEETDLYIETLERELKSYKEKDNSIRNAILNAQIAADSIILNAKNESRAIRENALQHVNEIRASVSTQRALLNEFHREYTQLLDKYMHRVRSEDFDVVLKKINELEAFFDRFAEPPKEAAAPPRPAPKQTAGAVGGQPRPIRRPQESDTSRNRLLAAAQRQRGAVPDGAPAGSIGESPRRPAESVGAAKNSADSLLSGLD